MTTKEEFLSHIASRLGRGRITEPPQRNVKGAPEFWSEFKMTSAERLQRFTLELEKVGGQATVCETMGDLHAGLRELLKKLKPASVLSWAEEVMSGWELNDLLRDFHRVEIQDPEFLKHAEACDVGITAVDYAIANTGTLVVCTRQPKMRSASLLPSVHLALVREEQIKDRMGQVLELFEPFKGEQAPASIHFITGPSRSADIENDLTIGVHGPAALHVFVLKEQQRIEPICNGR